VQSTKFEISSALQQVHRAIVHALIST
jgi:hypothetical protein